MLTIGIAGGSASGKSTVVNQVVKSLPADSVALVPQDSYYYDNSSLSAEEKKRINFDHPSSIEFPLLIKHLTTLMKGGTVDMPIYYYVSCTRSEETVHLTPKSIIIVEGILVLTNAKLRDLLDIKVYVDADPDERLMRIMERDTIERGRTVADVLKHYTAFVKPMHLQFIEPSKRYADIIIPQGGRNGVAIDILSSRIRLNL
ncbi:MAG: uridine kinase [Bacteroidales bacterium]